MVHQLQRAQVGAPCDLHAGPVRARFCTESRAACSAARAAARRIRRVLQGLFSGGEAARGRKEQNRRRTGPETVGVPDSGKFRSSAPALLRCAGLRAWPGSILQRWGRAGPTQFQEHSPIPQAPAAGHHPTQARAPGAQTNMDTTVHNALRPPNRPHALSPWAPLPTTASARTPAAVHRTPGPLDRS